MGQLLRIGFFKRDPDPGVEFGRSGQPDEATRCLSTSRRLGLVQVLVILLLVISGCSSPASHDLPIDSMKTLDPGRGTPSPIQVALGATQGEEAQAIFDNFQLELVDATVECMKFQGFDLLPDPLLVGGTVLSGEPTYPESLLDAEMAGFGITVGDAVGLQPAGEDDINPVLQRNQKYLQSLSSDEAVAFSNALNGENGCLQSSIRSLEPKDSEGRTFREALQHEIEIVEHRIANDERVLGAEGDWFTCMSDSGFAFVSHQEIIDNLYSQLDESGWLESADVDISEIQQYERDSAGAAWTCDQPRDLVLRVVRFEIEQAFVDENEALLASFKEG